MLNTLNNEEKAKTINLGFFFEQNGFKNQKWEILKSRLKKNPEFCQKFLEFCKNTNHLTNRIYLTFCEEIEIDNEHFKPKNLLTEIFEWIAAWGYIIGALAVIYIFMVLVVTL